MNLNNKKVLTTNNLTFVMIDRKIIKKGKVKLVITTIRFIFVFQFEIHKQEQRHTPV
jgi:hypothetical protein